MHRTARGARCIEEQAHLAEYTPGAKLRQELRRAVHFDAHVDLTVQYHVTRASWIALGEEQRVVVNLEPRHPVRERLQLGGREVMEHRARCELPGGDRG